MSELRLWESAQARPPLAFRFAECRIHHITSNAAGTSNHTNFIMTRLTSSNFTG